MKIALIFPPAWSPDMPPLGIYCIESVLKKHGNEVDVFDLNIFLWNHLNKHFKNKWHTGNALYWSKFYMGEAWKNDYWNEAAPYKILIPEVEVFFDAQIDRILGNKYDVIGFSLFEATAAVARLLIRKMRRIPNCPRLLIGGPAVEDLIFYNILHRWFPDIDAAIFGEGEIPVIQLINSWKRGFTPHGYPGIITCNTNGRIQHADRARPYNLADSPVIDFGRLDFSFYTENRLPISYARGCVGNCAFCNVRKTWKPFRLRPASYIVEEVTKYIDKYGDVGFEFVTPAINGHNRHMKYVFELCNKLIDTKYDIKWSANARFSRDLDMDCLKLLKKSGCYTLVFGLESASDKVLRQMGKPATSEMCERIIKNAARVGIHVSINIIVGFPSEDDADFEKTCMFIQKNSQYITYIAVCPCFLAKGSRMYSNPSKFGVYVKKGNVMVKKAGKAKLYAQRIHFGYDWVSADLENTIDVRLDRYKKLTDLINVTHIYDLKS